MWRDGKVVTMSYSHYFARTRKRSNGTLVSSFIVVLISFSWLLSYLFSQDGFLSFFLYERESNWSEHQNYESIWVCDIQMYGVLGSTAFPTNVWFVFEPLLSCMIMPPRWSSNIPINWKWSHAIVTVCIVPLGCTSTGILQPPYCYCLVSCIALW